MKNQFRVINRTTREEQVFNSEELKRFFYCEYNPHTEKIKYNNEWNDYAISSMEQGTYNVLVIINCLFVFAMSLYILSQWI